MPCNTGFIFSLLVLQAVSYPLAVQRASRTVGPPRPVERGGGAPAQPSLPRSLPSAWPPTHSRYLNIAGARRACVAALMLALPRPWTSLAHTACAWSFLCPQSLIPDIGPCLGQEADVDLHPEEAVLSGAEDEERERSDQDLQIRRTVTQVCFIRVTRVERPLESNIRCSGWKWSGLSAARLKNTDAF